MYRNTLIAGLVLMVASPLYAGVSDVNYQCVSMNTSAGTIGIALDFKKAPNSVKNFMAYVKSGHYSGTIFHRVIKGFMIQGGGFTADLKKKPSRAPIKSESDNGLTNKRGTVAMARTSDPHSASAQFFINVVDNGFLNFKEKSGRGWGYTVFGHIVTGMDVVDKIRAVKTGSAGPFPTDVPVETITIKKVTKISCAKLK